MHTNTAKIGYICNFDTIYTGNTIPSLVLPVKRRVTGLLLATVDLLLRSQPDRILVK